MRRYLISVGITGGTFALIVSMPNQYERNVFSLFVCAVALIAYLCGTGPALVGMAIAALAAALGIFEPVSSLRIRELSDVIRLLAFLGTSVMVIAIVHQLRQTQERLQAAHADLEYIKTARGVWNWSYDTASDRVMWGNYVDDMEVRQERNLSGWLALVHPEDRAHVEQSLRRALTTGNLEVDYRMQVSPARTLRFLTRAKLVKRRSGESERLVGICMEPIATPPQSRATLFEKINGTRA